MHEKENVVGVGIIKQSPVAELWILMLSLCEPVVEKN